MHDDRSIASIILSMCMALAFPIFMMLAVSGLEVLAESSTASQDSSTTAITDTTHSNNNSEKGDVAEPSSKASDTSRSLSWNASGTMSSAVSSVTALVRSIILMMIPLIIIFYIWKIIARMLYSPTYREVNEVSDEQDAASTNAASNEDELLGSISLSLLFKANNIPLRLKNAILDISGASRRDEAVIVYDEKHNLLTVSYVPDGKETVVRNFHPHLESTKDKKWILYLASCATKDSFCMASFKQEGPYLKIASMKMLYTPNKEMRSDNETISSAGEIVPDKLYLSDPESNEKAQLYGDGIPYTRRGCPTPTMPDVPDYRSSASDIASIIAANTTKNAHIEDPGGMRKLADVYGKHVPLEQRKEMTHRLEKIDSGVARIIERDSGKDVEKMLIEWLDSAGTLMQSYVSAARYEVDGEDKKQAKKVMREVSGALDSLSDALDKVLADTWSKDAARASLEAAMLSALVEAYGASPLDIDVASNDSSEEKSCIVS